MAVKDYATDVFINCPFDDEFSEIFFAIVFAVFDCGFRARCALEENDASVVRFEKIARIIKQCKYGVHDLSRTELCSITQLPRFNMPLELGVFLGAKIYGDKDQKQKSCLITDRQKYRYQKFISDISGQDIKSHGNKPNVAIQNTRDWLRDASKRHTIPGGSEIVKRYKKFKRNLPDLCVAARTTTKELTFVDYATLVSEWLKQN